MNNGFVNFGAMANPEYNKLVPEQLKMIEKFRKEKELVNFVLEGHTPDATEFNTYPVHCVKDTPEADLIDELKDEQNKDDTKIYYKNSINGMLNRTLQDDIKSLKELREFIIEGVCTDLCVMDFARTLARFLNDINRESNIFVIRKGIDTFDSPDHNREEWTRIAEKVMTQAGIEMVEDFEELEEKEKRLELKKYGNV
jgi:nicotinamidase-related amidase